jgi:hypothetical protein
MIQSGDEIDELEGKAILAEIKNNEKFAIRNIEAAKKELEFINKCIDKLQPYRQFAHLPDPEAHEASQFEEWKLELISRAENHLLTVGHIPTDHFVTMRQHPAFTDEILPAIDTIRKTIELGDPLPVAINSLDKNKQDIPKLLELK